MPSSASHRLRYVPPQTGLSDLIISGYDEGFGALVWWARSAPIHPDDSKPRTRRGPRREPRKRRDLLLRVLERARQKYRFVVIGYVGMPEHFHLLMTEPEVRNPSVVRKVVKERFTKLLHHGGVRTGSIWQKRFYDFNVCSTEKRIEKLRYIHRNPVKRVCRKT